MVRKGSTIYSYKRVLVDEFIIRDMTSKTPDVLRVEVNKARINGTYTQSMHDKLMKSYDVYNILYKKYNSMTKLQLLTLKYEELK